MYSKEKQDIKRRRVAVVVKGRQWLRHIRAQLKGDTSNRTETFH